MVCKEHFIVSGMFMEQLLSSLCCVVLEKDNYYCAETSVDVIRSSWYNQHFLMINYLHVSDDVLQRIPDLLNLQGKQNWFQKFGSSRKWVKTRVLD